MVYYFILLLGSDKYFCFSWTNHLVGAVVERLSHAPEVQSYQPQCWCSGRATVSRSGGTELLTARVDSVVEQLSHVPKVQSSRNYSEI